MVDEDTGAVLSRCTYYYSTCGYSRYADWSQGPNPAPITYRAQIRHAATGNVAASSAAVTVEFDQPLFPVDLSFTDPPTGSGTESRWSGMAQSSRTVSATPYSIAIEDRAGTSFGSCSEGTTCTANVGSGTYRASVESADGASLGRSGWWTLTPGEPPREERADDLDLLALAGLLSSADEVCAAVLTGPIRTYTMQPPSSVHDQSRVCETGNAAGMTIPQLLRAVAAAGGGTAVLWWLEETETLNQSDDDGEEPEPTPVPPTFWPDTLDSGVDQFMTANPALESRRTAQTVLKRCHRLTQRANLSESNCRQLPIFVSGDLDVPEPTLHDYESILRRPQWVQLNRRLPADSPGRRDWYSSDPRCAGNSFTIHCHEYPFFSTQQGGGTASPRPRLKLVTGSQNALQGRKLGDFYRVCGLNTTGKPFLSVPAPLGSNIPTLPSLCNGNG